MRYYQTKDGLFPSVSTILAQTTPIHERIKLAEKAKSWDKKREEIFKQQQLQNFLNEGNSNTLLLKEITYSKDDDPESWFNHCEEARNRGTDIHEYVKRFLERPKMDRESMMDIIKRDRPDLAPYWRGLESELNSMGEAIGLEFPVVHPLLMYAGRLDAFVYINKKRVLLDVKTFGGYQIEDKKTGNIIEVDKWELFRRNKTLNGKPRPKGEINFWLSWDFLSEKLQRTILQLTAYRMALEYIGYEIDEIRILIANKKGGSQRITIPNEIRKLSEQKWIERCDQFHRSKDKNKIEVTQIASMDQKEAIKYLNPREYFTFTHPDVKPLDFLPQDLPNRES